MTQPSSALFETDIHQLERVARGKVRDIYALGPDALLMVASDRISAFDVVMPTPIPDKGALLTQLSRYWFERTAHIVRNHLLARTIAEVLGEHPDLDRLGPRSLVVKRLRPLPFEAIVRGYLAGSGWKEYRRTGDISGIRLPAGLAQAEKLPTPIFTPSTKEASGHDKNISRPHLAQLVGDALAAKVEAISLELYRFAAAHAEARGILVADTKFEFGLDESGEVVLMDELLTPDSSRFWPADGYRTGMSPPSLDKQVLRDWLEATGWDKQPPAPPLPADVVARTRSGYLEALDRLTDGAVTVAG